MNTYSEDDEADDEKSLLTTNTSSTDKKYLSLKILSHNIWCVFIKGGSNRKQRLQILIANIKKDDPQIICLQEMHLFGIGPFLVCGDFLFLSKELTSIGYEYYTNPKRSTPLFGNNSGLMIFSKFPILEYHTNIFQHRRFGRFKGFIDARIALSSEMNDEIFVINTHLEHKNRNMQLQQMKEISDHSSYAWLKCRANGRCALICGDFNVCSNYSNGNAYDELESYMLKGLGMVVDLYSDVWSTKRVSKKQALDHMFINHQLNVYFHECKLVDYRNDDREVVCSDHYGLLTTFKVPIEG